MSIEIWTHPTTKKEYPIGNIGIALPKPGGFFDFFHNISAYGRMITRPFTYIPTYGLWAGPGYAGGARPVSNADIKWEQPPCMNDSITKDGANPDQCYSLVDAITKTHDFRYTLAEEAKAAGNATAANQLEIEADLEMFNSVIAALQTGVYECPTIYSAVGDYTLQRQVYTQIKEDGEPSYFDSTEIKYAKLLATAFALKLKYLNGATDAQVAEAWNDVDAIKNLIGVNVTVADPSDPTKTINIEEQSNGTLYEICSGTTKSCFAIDYNAQKTYDMGKVDGSVATEETFVYEGGGHITINGGTGNDKIYTGENEDDMTYYEINGGDGYDTYYLTDGENYIITDSGDNRIYKEDVIGGWIGVGNFYKDAADAFWESADGDEQLTQGTTWTLTFEGGSIVQLSNSIQSGDFGINLLTIPDNPTTTNPITGDLTPVDFNPDEQGIQTQNDPWGNVITDPGQPSPGREDALYDTTANDLINGGAGNDFIVAERGSDWVIGGDGNDYVISEYNVNNVIIECGNGLDIAYGGRGNDKIFGESYGEMDDLIVAGEIAASTNTRGDVVSGGGGQIVGERQVSDGDDYIYGSNASDVLLGGTGKDLLVGGGGDDVILGDTALVYVDRYANWSFSIVDYGVAFINLAFYAPLPGDVDYAVQDDDVIYGGTGHDYVSGGGGDDEIYGSSGDDTLLGDGSESGLPIEFHGDDYIDGGEGNDKIRGNYGSDVIFGGAGNDTIDGGAGDDYLEGEVGDDYLAGGSGADMMFGGTGNDTYIVDNLADYVFEDVDEGTDTVISSVDHTLWENIENLKLVGTAPAAGTGNDMNNSLTCEESDADNVLDGGLGADTMIGGTGNNTFFVDDIGDVVIEAASAGIDNVNSSITYTLGADVENLTLLEIEYAETGDINGYGNGLNNIMIGNSGNNILSTDSGNDSLDGGAGMDSMIGGAGNDTYVVDDAGDVVAEIVGEGTDTVQSYISYTLDPAVENLTLLGTEVLTGTGNALDNIITVNGAGSTLIGGSGNDTIYGGGGNDLINGGAGNDSLYGGSGNDTYCFAHGYGQDIVSDEIDNFDAINWIQIASDIVPGEVAIERVNDDDLKLSLLGTDDYILIDDYYRNSVYRILFNDGTVWDYETFMNLDDTIYGGVADDLIFGLAGDDTIYGGMGQDDLNGNEGNDALYGEEGNDTLYGLEGNDTSYGGSGNDWLRDYDGLNVMDGGPGDDRLVGIGGENTYIFNVGYGNDVIYSHPLYNKENELSVGKDTIIFGTGITPDNIVVGSTIAESIYKGWGHHELSIGIGNGEGVTATSFWPEVHPSQGYPDNITDFGVTRFIFSDGSVLNLEDILSLSSYSYLWEGMEESIDGSSSSDTLTGGVGNDRIYALAGNDVIDAGSGKDFINGGVGDDTIHAGDGVDILIGGAGEDSLYGESDNDMIMSGKGNDLMVGGGGDDNYIYYRGDGIDTIQDFSTTAEGNSLLFGDIYYEDIQGKVDVLNGALIIRISSEDEIHITGDDPETSLPTSHVIEVIGFADGRVMTYQDLIEGSNPMIRGDENANFLEGSSLDDIMEGYGGDDVVYGYDGGDIIYGGTGNDTIVGGIGNDNLYGGDGADTYIFIPGDGTDTCHDNDGYVYGGGNNLIRFSGGITHTMIRLSLGSLFIQVGDNGEGIRIPDFNPNDARSNPVIGSFVFDDGTILTYDELINKGFDLTGTIDADVMTGTNVVDRINAMAGNDVLSSGAGDDIIDGGEGSDALNGGAGNDTYVFNIGDGIDTIEDVSTPAEGNVIQLGEGITLDDLAFVRSGSTLTIMIGTNGDAINLLNFDQAEITGSHVVRSIRFADGTEMNLADFLNRPPVAASPIADQTAMEDAAFIFTIPDTTFADPDAGDTLTYSAMLSDGSALPDWLVFDAEMMTFRGTPANDHVGTLVLRVTATDKKGRGVSCDFIVNVENVNDMPFVASSIADQTVAANEAFTFSVPGNTFADVDVGDTLSYSATLSDGTLLPSWLNFDPVTITFSGVPTDLVTLSLKVTAVDRSGMSVATTFNLAVKANVIYGTNLSDFIIAGSENDIVYAFNGLIDYVYAGDGHDRIYGGEGADILNGGSGNDFLYGENGSDSLFGESGDDIISGGYGIDCIYGGTGNDSLNGGASSDILFGDAGNDNITGDTGDDIIAGGVGSDVLDGRADHDVLIGGDGGDTYLYRRTDGQDTINDYSATATDVDTLQLTDGITSSEPVIVKQNGDLYIFVDGSNYVKIASQFSATTYGIERLEVSDGHYITRSDIESIVNTMSAINNNKGMDVLQKYNAMMTDQTYTSTLAATWQQM